MTEGKRMKNNARRRLGDLRGRVVLETWGWEWAGTKEPSIWRVALERPKEAP